MKKQFNAIDLLKFVMAIFVVMIHVKPNTHSELLTMMFSPFMSIAVPVFFVVSSMLIFSKLNGNGGGIPLCSDTVSASVYSISVGLLSTFGMYGQTNRIFRQEWQMG